MNIYLIVAYIAPVIAGVITSILIPHFIKKHTLKKLDEKIIEVGQIKELKEVKEELKSIKKEILEMRGKTK